MIPRREKKVLEIAFRKDISIDSIAELEEAIIRAHLEGKDILLTITSTGGNPFAVFAFYDWIRIKEIPLITLALGNINSAAIILFLSGETRIAGANSIFRFHEFTTTMAKGAKLTVSEFKQVALEHEKEQSIYIKIVSERCGKPYEEAERILRERVAMTALEAKEFGLAQEIK